MTTFAEISSKNVERLPPTGDWSWDMNGVKIFEKMIPDSLIEAYVEERKRVLGGTDRWDPGFRDPCPYQRNPAMKEVALYRPLTEAIKPLMGGFEPGLHLCLTGFKSTRRMAHQDRVLNPEKVGEHYVAAWIALDDVHPDSGPFQYAPGSHRWDVIERWKVWEHMRKRGQNPDLPTWPSDCEEWVGKACEEEMERYGTEYKSFLPKKGDVLLWAASLIHQGSIPKDDKIERRALIAHYSSIRHRPDMPTPRRFENGSYFFHFPQYEKEPEQSTHRA